MIRIFSFCVTLLSTVLGFSQPDLQDKYRGLSIDFAVNHEQFQEERLSFRGRIEPGFLTNIRYSWGQKNNRHGVSLGFGKNIPQRAGEIVIFNNLRPELVYSFQKKISDFLVGGYFDAGSLLSFPSGAWLGNNSISYGIWSSLGLATSWKRMLPIAKRKIAAFAHFRIPFLGYVIRPSYGLPYPEGFLVDGTFDFQRNGMTGYILTSGKIRSVGSFRRVYFQPGLSAFIGQQNHEIGLSYILDYLEIKGDQRVRQVRNGLLLSTKIRF